MKPPIYDPLWSDDVKAVYQHDMQEIWDRSINPHIWNQYHNQLGLYLALSETGHQNKILDVGCAQATLAMVLAERGHQVWAVDLRQGFLDYAKTRYTHGEIKFLAANVLELELDEWFDLIFANQIVEHLVYPGRLVRRLGSMLRPGGRLVITTPNWQYFKNDLPSFRELGDVSRYEHQQFTADADGHFFAYRADELKSIFVEEGLTDVKVVLFETPFISGHFKVRFAHGIVPAAMLSLADRAMLAFPGLGRRAAHQLMIIGTARDGVASPS